MNIENTISSTYYDVTAKETTAKQMLGKVRTTLDSLESKLPNDKFVSEKKKQVADLIEKINTKPPPPKKAPKEEPESKDQNKKDDDDAIFGDKKKW